MEFLEVAAGNWGHVCVAAGLGEFLLLFIKLIVFDKKIKIRQGTVEVFGDKSAVILVLIM